jgi:hypothetical protein
LRGIGDVARVNDQSDAVALAGITTPHGQDSICVIWRVFAEAQNIRVNKGIFVHIPDVMIERIEKPFRSRRCRLGSLCIHREVLDALQHPKSKFF